VIEELTKKRQKQLALGILISSFALVYSIIVVPLWTINAASQDRLELLQERLAGLRQMAHEEANMRPRLERLKLAQINSEHYLKSTTETRAAAELQRLVKTITGSNKTTVTRTQILPATEELGFSRVALNVRLRGSMRGVVESIYDIESNQPLLFIEDLHLQDTSRRRSATTAAKQIDAEFELVAFMVRNT
jgi:general secretion pathway protein M